MLTRRRLLCGCGACGLGLVARPVRAGWRPRARPTDDTRARNLGLAADIADAPDGTVPWKWIVIHHTAAEHASLGGIDRYHRKKFGDPFGAEYHFIVGNGRKSPAGLVEPARWRHGVRAGHLFLPDRAPDSLAVCLVGNFQHRAPSGAEMEGLVQVTRALMARFDIPVERVTTHRGVDGRLTVCPGKLFPRSAFLHRLAPAP